MAQKQNTCLDVAASRQATTEKDSLTGASTSVHNYSTDRENRPLQISDYLGRGQAAAVPLRHLARMTGLPRRSVQLLIERERRTGVPILSDNQTGYYLPANNEEKEAFLRSMRHRAAEIMATADAVEHGGGEEVSAPKESTKQDLRFL